MYEFTTKAEYEAALTIIKAIVDMEDGATAEDTLFFDLLINLTRDYEDKHPINTHPAAGVWPLVNWGEPKEVKVNRLDQILESKSNN